MLCHSYQGAVRHVRQGQEWQTELQGAEEGAAMYRPQPHQEGDRGGGSRDGHQEG